MNLTARFLGAAQLRTADGASLALERKTAALLTYLALKGPTRRSQLTELLWPETRETAARNNLVHLLRKLKAAASAELVEGGEVLSLAEDLNVDVLEARGALMRGEYADLVRRSGELLQGLTYDDCPDLDDWMQAQRERLREWRRVALRADERRLEVEERFDEALPHALALIDLDPVSEDAWRRVMRLHYLRGDRPAALLAYQACQETLSRELGVRPMAETMELARQIESGHVPNVSPAPSSTLPVTVLRPPVLIGREREWALLDEAWRAGRVVYVSGPPGVGKTRLVRDFAASKGAFVVNEGRPGDARFPKSSSMRAFQNMYARVRGLDVPDWVKREMSRYLPEFVEEGFEAAPIANETDLLRFHQAMTEFLRLTTSHVRTHVIDDYHYFDAASLEDGAYMYSNGQVSSEEQHIAPPICTFRTGELSPEAAAITREMIEGGRGVLIELAPLDAARTAELLETLGVDASDSVRTGTYRYSGGNPLFVLETMKHLIESRQLSEPFPARLPPPKKVGDILSKRLERLSPPALQAARAAAILQSDFDLDQVAETLGAPLLDVAGAWEELEAAQIMHGERFSHDLVYEAVEAGIPAPVRQLLHRSAAKMLERSNASAARVAHHWRAGAKPHLSAPWLVRAAQAAVDDYRLADAARFYEEAARAFEHIGERVRAQEALNRRAAILSVEQSGKVSS